MPEWVYTISRALCLLGGKAHSDEIARIAVQLDEQNEQLNPPATVRDALQRYSSASAKGKKKGINPGSILDVFSFEPEKRNSIFWITDEANPLYSFAVGSLEGSELKKALSEADGPADMISKVSEVIDEEERHKEVFVREHWRSKPSPSLWKNQAFSIAHADDGKFEGEGLRAFFEYRQLGIKEATQGKFGAHVIRAVPGMESPGAWHSHELGFQMVYVTKGWVVFEYEGQGEHLLREGSCALQPPGIKHREVRHSDDMELIEIISPADFPTFDEEAPK